MSKLFKVGDKVGTMWGDGVVVKDDGYYLYPLVVETDDSDMKASFTDDGRLHADEQHPSIWHKETGSAPVVGQRPFKYPIYKKSKLSDLAVKFTGLTEGVVINGDNSLWFGAVRDNWTPHTDDEIWDDL